MISTPIVPISVSIVSNTRISLSSTSNPNSIRHHNWVTAIFMHVFGLGSGICTIRDNATRETYFLNKGSFNNWKNHAVTKLIEDGVWTNDTVPAALRRTSQDVDYVVSIILQAELDMENRAPMTSASTTTVSSAAISESTGTSSASQNVEMARVEMAAASAPPSIEASMQSMLANTRKAINEAVQDFANKYSASPDYRNPSTVFMTSIPTMEEMLAAGPRIDLTPCSEAQAQGKRKTMEDAHFATAIGESGFLMGVFDGHGGDTVANFVNSAFADIFSNKLQELKNVKLAFEQSCIEIQDQLNKMNSETSQFTGSTGVVSYIDRDTNLIYTATLGDSEANIYRQENGVLKSIPLSTVRDWESAADLKRGDRMNPGISNWFFKDTGEEKTRVKLKTLKMGINVSRAFGDTMYTGSGEFENTPVISQKPKVTVNKLMPGDRVVLCCDGLKDYASEDLIVGRVGETPDVSQLAQRLLDLAFERNTTDNVTVLALGVL